MLLVVLLYALLASTFVFAKHALSYANPCFLIGFRMLVAGSLLILFQIIKDKKSLRIKRADWWLFCKAALFHIYLSFILEFWSLQYLTALKTTIIYSSTPFIAALLSYFLLGERLAKQKILGIVIGLGGLAPVIMAAASGAEVSMEVLSISMPEIVLFGAVISGSYAWFIVKALMDKGYQLGVINGVAMLGGGLMSMMTAITVEGVSNPVHDWPHFLGWVLLLILVANIVVYNLYGWLLRRYSITFVTFSGFLCPSFGALYEWLFMSGVVTWHYFVSLVLVTLGLYVFHKEELDERIKRRRVVKLSEPPLV
jgi:drug/metabolite transporter (DMT)-like permease